jgi:glutamate-1-semialdehyde 2,1-aminomutase
MWGIFFTDRAVRNYAAARDADIQMFRRFHREALERGLFFAPSAFEAGFVSTAHTDADIEETISRTSDALHAAVA